MQSKLRRMCGSKLLFATRQVFVSFDSCLFTDCQREIIGARRILNIRYNSSIHTTRKLPNKEYSVLSEYRMCGAAFIVHVKLFAV